MATSITAGSGNVTNIDAVLSASDVTLTGTSSVSLANGVWGFAYSIGAGVAPNLTQFIVGEVANQSLVATLAELGAVAGDTLNIDAFYDLDPFGPASAPVYASLNGGAIITQVLAGGAAGGGVSSWGSLRGPLQGVILEHGATE